MSTTTRRYTIRGRVQGVGFRAYFQAEAEALGLVGWVRNHRDGSVEALVHGHAAAVASIESWAHHGPPAARVTHVDRMDLSASEAAGLTRFDVTRSV